MGNHRIRNAHLLRFGTRVSEIVLDVPAIVPIFQPVLCLRSGRIVGIEALARLKSGGTLLTPDRFLPAKDDEAGLLALFCAMLAKSVDAIVRMNLSDRDIYMSINVNAGLILRADFYDIVQFTLVDRDFDPRKLVFEILEGEAIDDLAEMSRALERLKVLGIRFALDDVGSAYASLMNIKDLPVDILKLDQAFSRKLEQRPHDLQFVMSLLGLARGLDKTLVVEGVETQAIVDALAILGVGYIQGHAFCRPLPEAKLKQFLKTWKAETASKTPRSLLGTYASHLNVVETCRLLGNQPLQIQWKEEAKNPHSCEIGKYFDQAGLHETAFGVAHKQFHQVMSVYESEPKMWEAAAEAFRCALVGAIMEQTTDDDVLRLLPREATG